MLYATRSSKSSPRADGRNPIDIASRVEYPTSLSRKRLGPLAWASSFLSYLSVVTPDFALDVARFQ